MATEKELIDHANAAAETLGILGGKGSGNFGHAGRKGKVGGSAGGSGDNIPPPAGADFAGIRKPRSFSMQGTHGKIFNISTQKHILTITPKGGGEFDIDRINNKGESVNFGVSTTAEGVNSVLKYYELSKNHKWETVKKDVYKFMKDPELIVKYISDWEKRTGKRTRRY